MFLNYLCAVPGWDTLHLHVSNTTLPALCLSLAGVA